MTWAKDDRALFRFGSEITPGELHIFWEAIGTQAETLRSHVVRGTAPAGSQTHTSRSDREGYKLHIV